MNKVILLFNTIKFLKPIQIYYRIFYVLRRKYRHIIKFEYPYTKESKSKPLIIKKSIDMCESIYAKNSFSFLNLVKKFDNEIDWNYSKYGKLWTYNLAYFEYLKNKEDVKLIYDFIENIENIRDGMEPFPISLRGISWIKFLIQYKIHDKNIDESLFAQYQILMDNLEYHLLGNHLLENGFSLLFGAYYFEDKKLYDKANEILSTELKEQILQDGGHFELSPMYHQIMLFRILDCFNLLKNNHTSFFYEEETDILLNLIEEKAKKMLIWLEEITFSDGSIPLFNDSTKGIAPETKTLISYAKELGILYKDTNFTLGESGYRKIIKEKYECVIDIGKIGPDYIPGHAHADTFGFEMYIERSSDDSIGSKAPFIVDTGLSTYETNKRRSYERSTRAHNTVEIKGLNSSEVWGGFRVANRIKKIHIEENTSEILAKHDGYKNKVGIMHTRNWIFTKNSVTIKDKLNKKIKAVARLHFHPDVTEDSIRKKVHMKENTFTVKSYNYADGFNKLTKAMVLEVNFEKELEMIIKL